MRRRSGTEVGTEGISRHARGVRKGPSVSSAFRSRWRSDFIFFWCVQKNERFPLPCRRGVNSDMENTTHIISGDELFRSIYADYNFSNRKIRNAHETYRVNRYKLTSTAHRTLTTNLTKRWYVGGSWKRSIRTLSASDRRFLSSLAYQITADRCRKKSGIELDAPFCLSRLAQASLPAQNQVWLYTALLSAYTVRDTLGVILSFVVDPCRPHGARCVKALPDGSRCNGARRAGHACALHQGSSSFPVCAP